MHNATMVIDFAGCERPSLPQIEEQCWVGLKLAIRTPGRLDLLCAQQPSLILATAKTLSGGPVKCNTKDVTVELLRAALLTSRWQIILVHELPYWKPSIHLIAGFPNISNNSNSKREY